MCAAGTRDGGAGPGFNVSAAAAAAALAKGLPLAKARASPGAPVAALAALALPLVEERQVAVPQDSRSADALSTADHAVRAAGMPCGGGFLSSHTGLEVAMIAPVEETAWVRRKLSAEVSTAWVIWPPASWVVV
jgi:hypothetical protein